MKINGQVVLITGAGSGMGKATAEYLSQQGACLVLLDINKHVEDVAKSLGCAAFIADVTSADDIAKVLDTIEKEYGTPRILINCAGICPGARTVGRDGPHDLGLFEKTLSVNLIGSFNMLRLCANRMAKAETLNDDGERGVIINTASIAAYEGQIGQAAYAASKGGIVSMTLPIARELAKFGVRVVTIAPGIMETPMITAMPEEVQDSLKSTTVFPKRLGQAQEFAKLAEHIIGNAMINGTTIRLDGALRLAPR